MRRELIQRALVVGARAELAVLFGGIVAIEALTVGYVVVKYFGWLFQ